MVDTLQERGTVPERLILPQVVFSPTTPDKLAGIRIEPPPSIPRARGQIPEATATADPLLEPPG